MLKKEEKKICIKVFEFERFKFVHTNANIIQKLILNLNATMEPAFQKCPLW